MYARNNVDFSEHVTTFDHVYVNVQKLYEGPNNLPPISGTTTVQVCMQECEPCCMQWKSLIQLPLHKCARGKVCISALPMNTFIQVLLVDWGMRACANDRKL